MTLKEKFENVEIMFENQIGFLKYDELKPNAVDDCVKIADEFAIRFAEWICLKADVPYIKGTMDNILEIFKKEKGL